MSADARQQRLIANEQRLRSANELVDAGRDVGPRGRRERFLCECSDNDCSATLELYWDEYREVREHPSWFVIRQGHETADVDRIIERRDGYTVVDKVA